MLLRVLALLAIVAAAARPVARWLGVGSRADRDRDRSTIRSALPAVVNGRPLSTSSRRWRATSLARDARPIVSGSSASTDAFAAEPDLLREEIDRLEPIAGVGDPATALAPRGVRRARRGSRRQADRAAHRRSAQRMADAPSIPDAQLLLFTPIARAATQSRGDARRSAARSMDAARLGHARFLSRDSTTYRVTLKGRTFARGTAAPNEEVVVRAVAVRARVGGGDRRARARRASRRQRSAFRRVDRRRLRRYTVAQRRTIREERDRRAADQRARGRRTRHQRRGAATNSRRPRADRRSARSGQVWRREPRARARGNSWRFGTREPVNHRSRYGLRRSHRHGALRSRGASRRRRPRHSPSSVAMRGSLLGPKYVLDRDRRFHRRRRTCRFARFVPWLGTVLTERLVGEPGAVIGAEPGAQLPRPRWADAIELSDGQRTALGESLDVPARAGTYFLTSANRRVGAVVVNPSADESVLDRYTANDCAIGCAPSEHWPRRTPARGRRRRFAPRRAARSSSPRWSLRCSCSSSKRSSSAPAAAGLPNGARCSARRDRASSRFS